MHFARPILLRMPEDFAVDERLAAESHPLGDLTLCRVLLFDDARFPWIVLVPRKHGLVEITDLASADRRLLLDEIGLAMDVLKAATDPYKLNVAALGNSVRQLHVHVISRFPDDAAWPSPVWGRGEREPYEEADLDQQVAKLRKGFGFDGSGKLR